MMLRKFALFLTASLAVVLFLFSLPQKTIAQNDLPHGPLDNLQAHPPIHLRGKPNASAPTGLSPQKVRAAYNLPSSGGTGTIAIIDAYGYPTAKNDLDTFSAQYGLPLTSSGFFSIMQMAPKLKTNGGWAMEQALDIQWAHAIAPQAKILLVEARSASGTDLLNAVNYARQQKGVVAVSMSWGGAEFAGESSYDAYFTSNNGGNITFFASSGDNGAGVQWPAVSSNVTGVGGTNLYFNSNGSLSSEVAWSGSGGGLSSYETEPAYQSTYGVPSANNMRAVPDVSYTGGPDSAVSVYDSTPVNGQSGWLAVYGTSVGSPQWAAIKSLGGTAVNTAFYTDATSNYSAYFRDITTGSNGSCGFYCTALTGYDYVTGLGSPSNISF